VAIATWTSGARQAGQRQGRESPADVRLDGEQMTADPTTVTPVTPRERPSRWAGRVGGAALPISDGVEDRGGQQSDHHDGCNQ
jgi:hypothetical protein